MSLKSISFMRESNLSFVEWFELIFLSTFGKKPLSVNEITRISRQTNYDTVNFAVRKIRKVFAKINHENLTDFVTEIRLSKGKRGKSKSKLDKSNLPKKINVHITTSKGRRLDKIHFSFSKKDAVKIANVQIHYRQSKVKPIEFTQGKYQVKTIKESWYKKLRENLMKGVKGVYHNISMVYLYGHLAEYAFKYNFRKEECDKFKIFLNNSVRDFGQNCWDSEIVNH